MTKRILIAAALTVGMAMPVAADPSVGLGLSIAFGNGRTEAGVGIRLFSTDRRDHAAASLGLDYMFSSSRIRPTVGAAYLGRNSYIGADMGFSLNGGGLDFGLSAGGVKTKKRAAPAAAPAVVVPPRA